MIKTTADIVFDPPSESPTYNFELKIEDLEGELIEQETASGTAVRVRLQSVLHEALGQQ